MLGLIKVFFSADSMLMAIAGKVNGFLGAGSDKLLR
jgi:hypothetical protein